MMNRIGLAALFSSAVLLGACSAGSSDTASFTGAPGGDSPGASNAGASSGGASSDRGTSGAVPTVGDGETPGALGAGTQGQGSAGILTAGVWDDNLNFDFFSKYVDTSTVGAVPAFTLVERQAARTKWAQRTGAHDLDVTFLLDTTGSMGDELAYLQSEIDGIAQTIATKFPQADTRYGLVLYKDHVDTYVTRWFDFKGISEFRQNLMAQDVGGGGDYPEAVAEGLAQTMTLSWRTGAVSRLVFWVADAPAHPGAEGSVRASIDAAVQQDVHIYPVAASGADDRTELTMRSAAQITGGRYVFLTDDSGVGDDHAEPHIPCYQVTKFNRAIVRMVDSEMSGAHIAPDSGDVLRTVGSPVDGQCATKAAGPVLIY